MPVLSDFNQEEIIEAVHFFFNYDDLYINDLSLILNRSVDDCVKLFKQLKIANRKCMVKCKCERESCKKDMEISLNAYSLHEHHYCSRDCYWEDKTNKVPHGEDSVYFNRIKTHCTNCGKEISVIPYDYNKTNQHGDNHNFCSPECYWAYRSKYYVGEKSSNWHRTYTPEQREKMAAVIINNSRNSDTRNTKIQLVVNDILESHNIKYEREYVIGYMQIDNYLTDYNLAIEVQGDYWHINPLKYNETGRLINETQAKDIIHDKRKRTMMKNKGVNILYLWESDIKSNPKLCELLILKYIETRGRLENYNSFNWYLDDSSGDDGDGNDGGNDNCKLRLRENLIPSFQEVPYSEVKKILKPKIA